MVENSNISKDYRIRSFFSHNKYHINIIRIDEYGILVEGNQIDTENKIVCNIKIEQESLKYWNELKESDQRKKYMLNLALFNVFKNAFNDECPKEINWIFDSEYAKNNNTPKEEDFFSTLPIEVLSRYNENIRYSILEFLYRKKYSMQPCFEFSNTKELADILVYPEPLVEKNLEYVVNENYVIRSIQGNTISLSIANEGIKYFEKIQSQEKNNRVFVIIAYNSEMDKFYESIYKPIIEEYSLKPVRIKDEEVSKPLWIALIEEIRSSLFVLADLTGERPNCYLEVGYAVGIGASIILTADESLNPRRPGRLNGPKIHFDIDGYQILYWDKDNINNFRTKLKEKIKKRLKNY